MGLWALMPLCICFSTLVSVHADGKLNYENPQSLILSRCECQRKKKIQKKLEPGFTGEYSYTPLLGRVSRHKLNI